MAGQTFNSCERRLEFADGEYLFRLPLRQLGELEEKFGGAFALYRKFMRLDNTAAEAMEVIRLGLIGGDEGVVVGKTVKVDANGARKLIERYATPPGVTLQAIWTLAVAIIAAACVGYEPEGVMDTEIDKKKATETPSI